MFTLADRDPRAEEAGPDVPARSTTCRSLRALFLAGEPLDEPTARWIAEALGKPVIDNYWQTETGWPILTVANGVEHDAEQVRQPGRADVRLRRAGCSTRRPARDVGEPGEKGVVAIVPPLPPGLHADGLGRRRALRQDLLDEHRRARSVYTTFDWGIRDADGYYFILGRTDDVINVAGHRLGTREIEESISQPCRTSPRSRWSASPMR